MNRLKSKNSNIFLIGAYYICIIMLLIHSTYKNGYLLYTKGLVSLLYVFKPLLMVLCGLFISYLIIIIKNILKHKKWSLKDLIFNEYSPIFISLLILSLPVNINPIILILSVLVISLLSTIK